MLYAYSTTVRIKILKYISLQQLCLKQFEWDLLCIRVPQRVPERHLSSESCVLPFGIKATEQVTLSPSKCLVKTHLISGFLNIIQGDSYGWLKAPVPPS